MEERLTWKEKLEGVKQKIRTKLERASCWWREHQTEISVFGPVLISGTVEMIKIISKQKKQNEERYLKENYIYDRSMGHYYELRRKLKSSEWLMIEKRKSYGEPLGEILQDMRVLK